MSPANSQPRRTRRFLGRIAPLAAVLALAPVRGAAPSAAEQWGILEIALEGPSGGNPFADVRLAAVFTDGAGHRVEPAGFYDGDGIYRIRFMPEWTGPWRYQTESNIPALEGRSGTFTVRPASPGNHGPVGVRHTFHFGYADGTPCRPIGTTSYTWAHRPESWEEQTLKTLAASPFNKLRMCVFPQDHCADYLPPTRFPFAGRPPRAWDFTRFNPQFFRHLELRIGQLRDLGIECDLILFHPYGRTWGFDAMDAAGDDRYLRYAVARFAAYRNIWWSMANEYDAIAGKTDADWDRMFQVVRDSDPYHHLRSIHNENRVYDNNRPWVTHASMQYGTAVESPGTAAILRDAYGKPVVYDEVQYEGNHAERWAQLSGRELVRRIWAGTVGGTYVGHGEYFRSQHGTAWVGEGGTLGGESPPRIAFLRKILEAGPPEGIDLIDRWENDPIGGKPGEYYLVYFGREAPASWVFQLPAKGLADGMAFRAEVVDTWEMTIAPVDGTFVVAKGGSHHFADRNHRSIGLPSRQGIALRIMRAGAVPGAPSAPALPAP